MNGYDRLKKLYKEYANQDKPLIQIVKHLLTIENMSEFYSKEEKGFKQMMEYINNKAKELAVNNVSIVEEEKVYNWALEYFEKSNDELGLTKEKEITPIKNISKTKVEDNNQLNLGV